MGPYFEETDPSAAADGSDNTKADPSCNNVSDFHAGGPQKMADRKSFRLNRRNFTTLLAGSAAAAPALLAQNPPQAAPVAAPPRRPGPPPEIPPFQALIEFKRREVTP